MKNQKKSQEGLTVKKDKNFSRWYNEILNKAEIIDLRYNIKGFIVIRPWGAMIIENIYKIYEKALQEEGHKPSFFPIVIPEKNFKKESSHVKGFSPEVFWLQKVKGEDKLALRPTSETAFYQMYSLWIRSHRDLPLKLYQRANVFRCETKATRPLIRGREFYWIEAHDAFSTNNEADKQVQQDITITERIVHNRFGIPFLPMKRPEWDKFPGAVYTIAGDCMLPDNKLLQIFTTHNLGNNFSKPFKIKFKDKDGKEKYVWQTCYGPGISRILASIISIHGDDNGLIIPFCISPIQVIIIPIFNSKNQDRIISESEKIATKIRSFGINVEIDISEKRPGEKYYEYELRGVPFRLEIGEKEIKSKKLTLFIRDTKKKQVIHIDQLSELKKLGEQFDKRLKTKADNFMRGKIVNCKTKEQIKKAIKEGKIARVNFCSIKKSGARCAEYIEKEINAEVRGILGNKQEKPIDRCIICNKKATQVVYIGKSY